MKINVVLHSLTWVNHRDITLNKKTNYRKISFIRIFKTSLNHLHFKNAYTCPHVLHKILERSDILIQALNLDTDYPGGTREKESKRQKKGFGFGNVKFLSLVIGT